MVSAFSQYSDISIDPVIRMKAERILESHPRDKSNTLDVIKEESGAPVSKLTVDKLKTLDSATKLLNEADKLSNNSRVSRQSKGGIFTENKARKPDIFESKPQSKFEESSMIDQDDSYGNYRPAFLIKKHKVTGRTEEIMKLQRMQSLDQVHALLGPVQPDLSGEKPQHRRMYMESDTNKLVNHIAHSIKDK